jgi:ATP-dependent Clp protease ATP-binding subunit ClpX
METLQKQLENMFQGKQVPFGIPVLANPGYSVECRYRKGRRIVNQAAHNQRDEAILKRIREFNLKPKEITDLLNRFVIGQDEAKKVLSVSMCDHFNHVRRCMEDPSLAKEEYHKQNILLLGPTGVGKTYLMRTIARLIGVPFVKADATKFSETGYVGADVEDFVRDLVKVANGNIEFAQYGIIYIDEIDKIASASATSAEGRFRTGRADQSAQDHGRYGGQPVQPNRHHGSNAGHHGRWLQGQAYDLHATHSVHRKWCVR